MRTEVFHQVAKTPLATDQVHGEPCIARRLQQPEGHRLGDHIAQAHPQCLGLGEQPTPHRLLQFIAETEDLVRIAQDGLAGFSQHQPAPLLA